MKKTIFLAILLLCVISAKAQDNQDETISANIEAKKGFWSIHFGTTFPLADFGADNFLNDDKALGAAVGVGAGLEFSYPLNDSGFGFFLGFDVNYNWLKSDERDDILETYDELDIDEDDFTFFRYFNIPVAAGLNYTIKADEKVSVYGNIGVVANFLKLSNFNIEYQGGGDFEAIESVTEFDLSSKIGVKLGGGVIINNNTFISLNYFGLGKHKIKATTSSDTEGVDYDYDWKSKVNYLTLTVGFKL